MEQQKNESSSLEDLLALFKKHRRGMSVIFGGTILLTILWTFLQTPTFEVNSRILIKYGREYIYRPVDQLLKGDVQPALSFNRDDILNTEIQIFRSSELLASVISSIGLKNIYPEMQSEDAGTEDAGILPGAIERFKKKLSVKQIKGSGVLLVSFQHHDADVAVKATRKLLELFKERHLQIFRDPRMSFLESQRDIYRKKLEESRKKLQDFKHANHIISLEDQQKLLLQEYAGINSTLIQGRSRLEALNEKIPSLEALLNTVPEAIMLFNEKARNNSIESARAQLLNLQLKEHDLLQKYREDNRLVKGVREEIRVVEAFLSGQNAGMVENTRTGRNSVYQQLKKQLVEAEVERDALQAENRALEVQLSQLENQLEELGDSESEFHILNQQVEINEKNYKSFISKLEETRILDAMDNQKIVNAVVIEHPVKPVKPVKPKKKINILVGIILGAAASFSYALFYDHLFTPWTRRQDTNHVST